MSITKSNCKLSSKYCFEIVMSFLEHNPEDLKVIAFLSKQSYEAFKKGLNYIRKLSIPFLSEYTFEILGKIPRLEELDLKLDVTRWNGIESAEKRSMECLSYLGNLIFLRTLTLETSLEIDIDIGVTLSHLPTTLQQLDLSGMSSFWVPGRCAEPKAAPRQDSFIFLQKMPFLRNLNFSNCDVSNEHLRSFPTSLQVLHLSECFRIRDEGFSCLKAMTDLRDLNLSNTCTSGLAVSDLCSHLTKLEILYLKSGYVDLGLVNLPFSLQVLELSGSDITRDGLQHLHSLPNLLSLNLAHCFNIVDADLNFLPPRILYLNIAYCKRISDEGIPFLPKTLKSLVMEGCEITGKTFSSLPKLKYLDVTGSDVRNEALLYLPTTLIKLHIGLCERITDCGLFYLQQCLNANRDILYLKSIPLQLFHDSIQYPISLRWLNIRCCKITNIGLGYLPKIEHIEKTMI